MKLLTDIVNSIIYACRDGGTNRIKNVSAGIDPTDAVNVSQLRPYKSYVVMLTQSSSNAPTATVLENTIGEIVFIYIGPGNYRAVSDGLFSLGKTVVMIGQSNGQMDGINYAYLLDSTSDEDDIVIQTKNTSFSTGDDGKLFDDYFEIRVYN